MTLENATVSVKDWLERTKEMQLNACLQHISVAHQPRLVVGMDRYFEEAETENLISTEGLATLADLRLEEAVAAGAFDESAKQALREYEEGNATAL
jgi:hypothetical protein